MATLVKAFNAEDAKDAEDPSATPASSAFKSFCWTTEEWGGLPLRYVRPRLRSPHESPT